jgi:Flp pilus assembly pilin Flp
MWGIEMAGSIQRLRTEAGATAVEYALMVGGIAVVIILAVAFLGNQLNSDFECAGSAVEAMPGSHACTP